MFISTAFAQDVGEAVAGQPSMADAFWTNMGLIGLMFVLFYLLLIRPQQKRMQKQREMLDDLKKGDKVVTGGGLYGTVSKLISDTEVEIDLGMTKVVAMRYTIQNRVEDDKDIPLPKVAEAAAKKTKTAKKAAPAKKTTAVKKAPAKSAGTKNTKKKKA
jgi:preprotein translocase subunit YajC